VATSPAMPAGVIATVDARVPPQAWTSIEKGLRALPPDQLAGVRLDKFVSLDDKALDAARKAFDGAAR
jgi:hypothetical protein